MTMEKLGDKEICMSWFFCFFFSCSDTIQRELSPSINIYLALKAHWPSAELHWPPPAPDLEHTQQLRTPWVFICTKQLSNFQFTAALWLNISLSFFFILHEVTFLSFKWEVTSANSVLAPFMQRNQEGRKRRCGRFETKQNKLKLPCGCGADSCCPPTQAACPWRMDFICLSILWVLFQKGEGKQATKRSAVAGKLVINRRVPPWHDGGAAASLKFACLYRRMSWCDRHRDLRQIFSCLGSPLLLQCLHGIAELYWAFSTKCISTVHVHRPSRKIKFALHSSTEILPGQSRTAPAKIFLLLSPLFSLKL